MKLGKRRASAPRARHLSRYLGTCAIALPASYDRSKVVPRWGVLGNDAVGDCTIAAVGHYIDLATAAAGKPRLMTREEALSGYEQFGYVPGDPATDEGCDPQDVLDHWTNAGFAAGGTVDRLSGYCTISPTDRDEIRFAAYSLAGVYLGIELPAAIEPTMTYPLQPWDLPDGQNLSGGWAPGSLGGHAVLGVGYDAGDLIFISWGARYRMSWRFWMAYGVEAYGLLDRDLVNPGIPDETWAALEADMAALRQDRAD